MNDDISKCIKNGISQRLKQQFPITISCRINDTRIFKIIDEANVVSDEALESFSVSKLL